MAHYEIEVKSLLGGKENADALKAKMCELDPSCACISTNKQLNHYFIDGDINLLYKNTIDFFSQKEQDLFKKVVSEGKNSSVRTRKLDDRAFLVVKASIDDTTSENGVTRIEFESEVKGVTLDELDRIVLDAGFSYQAKWSREREEYVCNGINVCLDKNAGYGYVAEFEKMVEYESQAESVQCELRELMQKLDIEELKQDRLERMFSHYNKSWEEYYGTDKVFTIH